MVGQLPEMSRTQKCQRFVWISFNSEAYESYLRQIYNNITVSEAETMLAGGTPHSKQETVLLNSV